MRIAERQKEGSAAAKLIYRHGDQVDSTVYTSTSGPEVDQGRRYYAYGKKRSGGTYTDYRFTGQAEDDTGLHYFNARYYDPNIGIFISPDTLVPDPTNVLDYNRYLYSRGNPLKYNDPTGHCPAPPENMGATICMALFIQPESVPAGPFTVHGDGRSFDSNSAPAASRGYIWISTETGEVFSHMNPSVYLDFPQVTLTAPGCGPGVCFPTLVPTIQSGEATFPASSKNSWLVSGPNDQGEVIVNYKLVISGPLDASGTAPYINGTIKFFPNGDGSYGANWDRDGFPWAEAYYHDGSGGISTIFQDPAVRGNPYDLFGTEPGINPLQWAVRFGQSFDYGEPQMSTGATNR